ncbi:hypothetical protein ACFVRU_03685 [Streptomyces sp. NPDC057927]
MNKIYERTENGSTTRVSKSEGLAEINHAMMAGKRDVRTMSSITRTDFAIEYKDGRKVRLVLVDEPEAGPAAINQAPTTDECTCGCRQVKMTASKGPRVVTVKGKRYFVSAITPAQPRTPGAKSWVPEAYLSYWTERNGETFGATRHASASRKPGTVGRAIWDAVNAR